MTVEAVVWDIGNVLLEWQPERVYDRLFGEERRREVFEKAELHRMNLLVDEGQNFHTTVLGWADERPDYGDEIRAWRENWLEMCSPPIERSVRMLRALKAKGVPCFSLTNFGIETLEIAQAEFDFLNLFDREYVSGRLRLLKPDPAIYAALEEDSGVAPEGLLYADDRPENVAAANARGWQGHVFTEPGGFAAKLVDAGLLTEAEAA